MWPFTSNRRQDDLVRKNWGRLTWVGIEIYGDHVTTRRAPRAWVKKIVARASAAGVPIMISLRKQIPVAEDRKTGQIKWWDIALRIACPAIHSAIDAIKSAIDDDRYLVDGLGGLNIDQKEFEGADEALKWCPMDTTWRCNFTEVPSKDQASSSLPTNNVRGLAVFIELPEPNENKEAETAFLVAMAYQAVKLHPKIPQLMLKLRSNIHVFFETSCEDAVRSMCVDVHAAHPTLSCWVLSGRYSGKDHPVPFSCRLLFTVDDGRGEIIHVTEDVEWKQSGLQIVESK